jgi:hypothetical protein
MNSKLEANLGHKRAQGPQRAEAFSRLLRLFAANSKLPVLFTLVILRSTFALGDDAPTITFQPTNQTVVAGATATCSVTAAG